MKVDESVLWFYRARLVRVVDGDTVWLDIDVGFYFTRHAVWQPSTGEIKVGGRPLSYRVARIDAPETRGAEKKAGRVSTEALERFLFRDMAPTGEYFDPKDLIVRTTEPDNFGRYLVELWADGENVSDWMLEKGHATPFEK